MLRSIPTKLPRISPSTLPPCTCRSFQTQSYRAAQTLSSSSSSLSTPILTNHSDLALKQIFDEPSYSSRSPTIKTTGLFQQSALMTPSDFPTLALRTTLRAQLIVNRICKPSDSPQSLEEAELAFLAMVKNLDRLSDLLCGVIDLAELVRNVHPVEEWNEGANEAYEELCGFMNELNTNVGLYEALKSLHSLLPASTPLKSPKLFAAYAVAIPFLRDFEKSGIQLPSKQRTQFVELSTSILQLGRKFLQNIGEEKAGVAMTRKEIEEGMGNGFARRIFEGYTGTGAGEVLIDPSSYEGRMIARQSPSEELRKRMYLGLNNSPQSHVDTLEELLLTRSKLANLVGRESWGDVALEDKMAKSPRNVMTFLNSLNQHNQPLAKKDLELLQSAKRDHLGLRSSNPIINAWDRDYYSDLSSNASSTLPDISPFFSVGTCFQGLSRLFNSLYGVRFEVESVTSGEAWDPKVRKLRVISDSEGGPIGTIYCDLFAREGKQAGAAHYTIRCSRRLDDDDIEGDFNQNGMAEIDGVQVGREDLIGLEVEGREWIGREGKHQEPMIVLVCGLGNLEDSEKGPTFLQWHEVETLYHEMGHAIHSMIGRTDYHNVSGTRCATDFVELPSILMEHFLSSPQVLTSFSAHYKTGRALPKDILTLILNERKKFSALETSTQIMMAALDQQYHSPLSNSSFNSTKVLHKVQLEFNPIPYGENSTWQTSFGHLFGYGATYYSYLFDRSIAAKVFKDKFSLDPLSRESGEEFKEKLLKFGGGKDPWEMVGSVVGGEEVMRGGEKAMEIVGQWGIEESERSR